MQSNFEFLAGKFPKLAEYGRKAEKYLYADNEVCMFFISRIFDNVVKYLCAVNDVNNDGIRLAEPINDLFQKNAIDEGVYLLLETMRIFRNGNAHNKDYSLNESMILLQMSHILCEWLMETYGKSGYTRKGFTMPKRTSLKPGDIVECTVNNVIAYGVFAQVDGMTGLLHRNEILSGSVEGYKAGDKFTAKIIGVDSVQGHVALSVSQLQQVQPPVPAKTTQPAAPAQPQLSAMSDNEFLTLCATGTPQQIAAAIKNGANVKAANSKGHTTLMMAAMHNTHSHVIGLLINSGADVNAKSKTGINALSYAEKNTHIRDSNAFTRLQSLTKG